MRSITVCMCLAMFLCLLALSPPVNTQIIGTVTDSTEAVLAGVEINAINTDAGTETKGITTDLGLYSLGLPSIEGGIYV